jgi:hypothetical protein
MKYPRFLCLWYSVILTFFANADHSSTIKVSYNIDETFKSGLKKVNFKVEDKTTKQIHAFTFLINPPLKDQNEAKYYKEQGRMLLEKHLFNPVAKRNKSSSCHQESRPQLIRRASMIAAKAKTKQLWNTLRIKSEKVFKRMSHE